jgi:hypothetical protein
MQVLKFGKGRSHVALLPKWRSVKRENIDDTEKQQNRLTSQ